MMLDIFRPLPPQARRETRAAYQEFLTARDGAMDIEKQQLVRREVGMLRYEKPLPRTREVDRDLFNAQYATFDAKVTTPSEMLLLLSLVKANASEAFGVTQVFDAIHLRAVKNNDMCELTLMVEETYHTRILLSTALSYGVEMRAPYKPPVALRTLIAGVSVTPEAVSRPLTLAAEILGLCTFLNLLERSREVLRHDPELRDGVEERLCEVITDELGHMSFNRACLGPAGFAQVRLMLPIVARGVAGVVPEIRALGAGTLASESEIAGLASGRRLPEHVVKSAFLS